jgi:hypothetical protein
LSLSIYKHNDTRDWVIKQTTRKSQCHLFSWFCCIGVFTKQSDDTVDSLLILICLDRQGCFCQLLHAFWLDKNMGLSLPDLKAEWAFSGAVTHFVPDRLLVFIIFNLISVTVRLISVKLVLKNHLSLNAP